MPAVPMFPLSDVLFPFTPLALRVFEPRYLTMLGRLLDEPDPAFGVVLISRGHEAGGGDERTDIGTMARIVQVEAGEQDLYVVAVGGDRIAVDRWLDDDPHPVAEVSELAALEWNEALQPLLAEAEQIVRRVLALADELGEAQYDPGTPLSDDPVECAWQLAAIAPLGEYDRFALLSSRTAGGLLRATIDLTLDVEPLYAARVADARAHDDDLDGDARDDR